MERRINTYKNLMVYGVGLLFYSLGASLTTKARLGITPITSVGYITSYISGLSLGTTLFVMNVLLVLLQALILRNKFEKKDWLQIPISVVFSIFIDFTMRCVEFINPTSYTMKIIVLLIALTFMGLGIALVLISNAIVLPADGFARALAQKFKLEFGSAKVINDSTMVIITSVISITFLQRIEGIHIGTVIAALCLGNVAKWFMHHINSPIQDFVREKLTMDSEC